LYLSKGFKCNYF